MTQWTPKLEKLIRSYADYEEENAKDGLNPKLTVDESMARIAFRVSASKDGGYEKLCAAMGVDSDQKNYHGTIQEVIDLAAANGSDAADKLKVTREVWKKYAGRTEEEVRENLKRAKQQPGPF